MRNGYLPGGIWQIQLSSPGQAFQVRQVQCYRSSFYHGLHASRKCVKSIQATEPRVITTMSSAKACITCRQPFHSHDPICQSLVMQSVTLYENTSLEANSKNEVGRLT